MVKNRTLVVVMILAALAVPMAFADGLFVQSPLQPSGVEYTYASQLGMPVILQHTGKALKNIMKQNNQVFRKCMVLKQKVLQQS